MFFVNNSKCLLKFMTVMTISKTKRGVIDNINKITNIFMSLVQVCKGDTIQVTLSNRLGDGRVAAFHWHGQVQAETPWMDGVPYVTQCPIMPGQDFE